MPLAPGAHLGPYEITGPLGSGGMGEVYRARDTRLERTVAIKILPAQFSSDPVRNQRFEREAKTISSLNHPHICVLHDVGHQDGIAYLVMECVEGETLSRRLEKGPLPLEQALKYGVQMADALDKAHRSGVVHRDLKPGNVMLTKSGVKLLDFGLAKPVSEALASAQTISVSPAKSRQLTAEGAILGTIQYMSPEQLEGKETDARSDLFSFGAVLYEMVTGNHAFDGKSQASVIAAILEHEPQPLSAFQPTAPPALDRLIRTCLAKDPDERIQKAHDVKLQLQWIADGDSQISPLAGVPAQGKTWKRAGWLLAAAFAVLLVGGGTAWWFRSHQTPHAMYFNSPVPLPANHIALSPDGRTLAMVAYSSQTNKYVLWTYEVGGRGATLVQGTEEASFPFWSPDGRSIGFFSQGKLKRVDVSSGRSPQVVCDAPHGRGGAWSPNGVILFAPEGYGGLYRVSSAGGTPAEVTKASGSEFSHRWPIFLPDGKHFLFLAANFSGHFEKNAISLGMLDSPDWRPIVNASSNAAYADPGYLLYVRDNALVAQHFDSKSYVVSGEPQTVSDEVQYFPIVDHGVFAVAGTGTLVAQTGKGEAKSQLVWFDRDGKPLGTVGQPGRIANLGLSRDGRRTVVDQMDRDQRHVNIWVSDLANDAATRLTFTLAVDQCPIWSPDGKRIVFSSNRKFHFSLYQKNSDGSGSEQEIADLGVPQSAFWDWSRDGKYLLVQKSSDLWYMSPSDWQAKPFLLSRGNIRNAQFSPDGRWVAYSSNETGSWEVYVSPFPTPGSKWQVSTAGGEEPRWRRDGQELFYLSAEGKVIAVPVKSLANFEAGPPSTLFQTHTRQPISMMDAFSYDVSSDGQKFLINTRMDETNAAPLSIVLNWASELEK
jgi:serine/threonine protein kinase/Tol biopolymer transport system component